MNPRTSREKNILNAKEGLFAFYEIQIYLFKLAEYIKENILLTTFSITFSEIGRTLESFRTEVDQNNFSHFKGTSS